MKALHGTSKKANSTMASKKTGASVGKKDDKWKKNVGRRVKVQGVGLGSLAYYGETTLPNDDDGNVMKCGIVLEEDLGDCDGTAPDGTEYFTCDDGFGFFTSTDKLVIVDENGVAVKAKKKAPAKKKFDSPPSLRKKINRAGPKTTPAAKTKRAGVASKKKVTKNLNLGAAETMKLRMKKGNFAAPTLNPDCLVERKIQRKAKPTPAAASETSVADGADGATDDRPAFKAPDDWVEAKKRAEAERLEEEARQKYVADKEAQAKRMAEMEKKLAEEQEKMAKEAEDEAARRDAAKAERQAKRDRDAQDRADKRAAATAQAMTEILESQEQTNKAQDAFEIRTRELEEKRAAQKARIAALMARVKPVA